MMRFVTCDVTCSRMKGLTSVGEWLSLVEHLVRDQGVGGSNPLSPTNSFQLFTLPSLLQPFSANAPPTSCISHIFHGTVDRSYSVAIHYTSD
jgi:hypothetical protein